MTDMREIVDIRTVDAAIKIGGAAWFVVCLLIGGLLTALRRRGAASLLQGAFLASVGPAVIGLWLLYSWMTRYDPQTGYYGLDKVWVLAVNAALFIVIGAAYGYLGGRLWARHASQEALDATDANRV
ncbi:MAG: hypothetical protein FJX74_13500 [Armatimonadetes bacterium]|nr:hypothetical protein [Armatimonadota bacterium]